MSNPQETVKLNKNAQLKREAVAEIAEKIKTVKDAVDYIEKEKQA